MSDAVLRRVAAAGFVLSPLLFLADNLLHPAEYALGSEDRQLLVLNAHHERWQLAHLIGVASVAAGIVFILALALLVHAAGRPIAALVGGALALIGAAANAFLLAVDGFAWAAIGAVSDRRGGMDVLTEKAVLREVQRSPWLTPIHVLVVTLAIGLAVLCVAAIRTRLLRVPEVAVFLASLVLIGVESEVHSNVFYVAVALVYLLGGALIARRLVQSEPGGAGPS